MSLSVLLVILLWSLVEVHSQTAPYVSFMGENLPNHAYVNLTLVGNDKSDPGNIVRCHTDLSSCCGSSQGDHRGDWCFPNGSILGNSSHGGDIYRTRGAMRVNLRRINNAMGPSGIYRCDIPTDAVHDGNDISVRETVYVGLYPPSDGAVTIPGGVILSRNTLTCISTGGPATTVTWTRDSAPAVGESETVLDDPVTATYTHTLTVASAGLYTCTVANDKPSTASASITVQGASPPSDVTAVQTGLTSIRVTWTPPTPLGNTTGYIISYTNEDDSDSGSVTISGGSTDNETLTGLQNGDTYTISIVATSDANFPSVSVAIVVGLVPWQLMISAGTSTTTSIPITISTASDSVVTSYEVMWETDDIGGCSGGSDMDSATITDGSTSYDIMGLEEDSSYTVTVTASNSAGSSEVSNTVTAMTLEAAPSAPPTSVSVSEVTSSSITVQWGRVRCIHRNGDITGYSVLYEEVGSGSTETMPVSGGSATEYTISGLMLSTNYSIQVAAETSAGTGPYSDVIITNTLQNVHLSLNGRVIPNHGYVVISDIGTANDDTALLCHTNRPPPTGSSHSGGEWFAPDGTGVTSGTAVPGFRRNRGSMVVRLYRNTATGPPAEGIYQCQIQDDTHTLQTLHAGLYSDETGAISISGGVTLTVDSDLNGASPQFTLTCISTGGPATNVTWTRDSVTITEGTETVLDDPVTARYTHTLTVTERLPGLYTCTVANNKPSSDSAQYYVNVVREVFEVEVGERQVNFTWSPAILTTNNRTITNYTLFCSPSPSPSSLPLSLSQSASLTVTGFTPDTTYTCSVVANRSIGYERPAATTFTTQQDYLYFQLHLTASLITSCSEFVLTERRQALEDITSALLQQLISSCPDCEMNDIIDMQLIDCGSESVILYRARLEGTSQTDSSSLISLIDDWVNTGPSFIVTGILMKVDSECTVAIISSLSDGECTQTSTDSSPSSAEASSDTPSTAIIGGVVAIVAVIVITIGVVIVVYIVRVKTHQTHGEVAVKKTEDHHDSGVSPRYSDGGGAAIPTTSNMAYELTTLPGPEDDSHEYEVIGRGKTSGSQPATLETEATYEIPDVTPHPPPATPPLKTTHTSEATPTP